MNTVPAAGRLDHVGSSVAGVVLGGLPLRQLIEKKGT
jgi:hypothetical protein